MTMLDPLGDGKSALRLLDSMGNSLSVVNDARQSFAAESAEWTERDGKLLRYLAKHHHTSPFRGVVFKWSVKAPLFIARGNGGSIQWRLLSLMISLAGTKKASVTVLLMRLNFTSPLSSCSRAKTTVKRLQGLFPAEASQLAFAQYAQAVEACKQAYAGLLLTGVSKEQARAILPSALYTSFVWTCSLQALFHFISLRIGHGAQGEIVAYAKALLELGRPVAPEAFDAFAENNYQF
jgi:thymidylate synthase (FAD)